MKMKNILSIFIVFLLSISIAAAIDLSPIVTLSANVDSDRAATLVSVATDMGDNAGIEWVKIYEREGTGNYSEVYSKTCNQAQACTGIKIVVKPNAGTWEYYAEAKDISGKMRNSSSVNVTLQDFNVRPEINISDVNVTEDTGINYNLVDLWLAAHDDDTSDSQLAFSILSNSNPGLGTLELNSSRYLQFTTNANITGFTDVMVNVNDGSRSRNDTFRLNVDEVNDMPWISPVLDNLTMDEDTGRVNLDLTGNENDVEDTAAGLNWSFVYDNAKLNITTVDEAQDQFEVSGMPDVNGVFNVTAVLTDSMAGTATQVFTVTLNSINDAPRINASNPFQNLTWEENTNMTLNLLDHFYDVENDTMTFSFSPNPVSSMTVSINQTSGEVVLSPDYGFEGSMNIWFEADDGSASTITPEPIVLTVTPVNSAPVIDFTSITPIYVDEDSTNATIDMRNHVIDPDDADSAINWTVSYTSNDVNVSVDNGTKTLTVTALNNFTGNVSVDFVATDGKNSTSASNTIVVLPVNDAPTLTQNISDISIMENESATVDLTQHYTDIDGDNLTYGVTGNTNINVTINQTTGIALLEPLAGWNGTETLMFVADDSVLTTNSNQFNMTVMHINQAPVLNFTGFSSTFAEDSSMQIMDLGFYVADPDHLDSEITWTATGYSNATVTINDTDKTADMTPDANYTGLITITFTAMDPMNASDSADVIFNVTPVNDAPTFNGPIANMTVFENYTSQIDLTQYFTDIDGDVLTYTVTPASNVTITINNTTGIAYITPDAGIGNTTRGVGFTASDGSASAASNVVTLNITTRPPVSELINSSVNGTLYNGNYSNGQIIGVYAFTYMLDSTVTDDQSDINNTILTRTTVTNSWLVDSNATDSVVTNSFLTRCFVNNATVKNYQATDCRIEDSIVDPPSGMADLTGSNVTGESEIYSSNVTYSAVHNSFINDSNVNVSTVTDSIVLNSTVENSTVIDDSNVEDSTVENTTVEDSSIEDNSTVANSFVNDSEVHNSTVDNSTVENGSEVMDSTVTDSTLNDANVDDSTIDDSTLTDANVDNVTVTNSTIVNSTVDNVNVTDANITDGVIYGGTVGNYTHNGTDVNLTDVVNVNPVIHSFTASPAAFTAGGSTTFTWNVTDANVGGPLNDSVSYFIDFGDGQNATFNSTVTSTAHTYSSAGSPVATFTATDSFAGSDSDTETLTVNAPAPPAGGGSSGGGGGGRRYAGTYTLDFEKMNAYTKTVRENDKYKFVSKEENHSVTIGDINRQGVTLTIASNPITTTIQVGTMKKFNLDGDDTYDLGLSVLSSGPLTSRVKFELLNETVVRSTFSFLPDFMPEDNTIPPAPVPEPELAPEPTPEPVPEPTLDKQPMGKFWAGLLIMVLVIVAGLVGYFGVREYMIRKEGLVY